MSVLQYIEQMQVRRENIPKVAQIDELDTIETQQKIALFKQSQMQLGEVKIINRHADYLRRQRKNAMRLYYANHEKSKEKKTVIVASI